MILLENINIVPEMVDFREIIQKYYKIVDCIPQIVCKIVGFNQQFYYICKVNSFCYGKII